MENKKYLNKILDHLLKGTKIVGYGEETIFLSFLNHPKPYYVPISYFYHPTYPSERPTLNTWFSDYCRDKFGLTLFEIVYLWREYVDIMKNKIRNGEQ